MKYDNELVCKRLNNLMHRAMIKSQKELMVQIFAYLQKISDDKRRYMNIYDVISINVNMLNKMLNVHISRK